MSGWLRRLFGDKQKSTPREIRGSSSGNPTRPRAVSATGKIQPFPYRGVKIYNRNPGCCIASRSIHHITYLASEAPALPLEDCDNPSQCKCRYEHLDDRRQEVRRDSDYGLPSHQYTATERRVRGDRRRPNAA